MPKIKKYWYQKLRQCRFFNSHGDDNEEYVHEAFEGVGIRIVYNCKCGENELCQSAQLVIRKSLFVLQLNFFLLISINFYLFNFKSPTYFYQII